MMLPQLLKQNGSSSYFTYNQKYFEKHQEECCKLIAFYTLYLFGHHEEDKNVLIIGKNKIHVASLEKCLKLLQKGQLKNRVFHHDSKNLKMFSSCGYKGYLITNKMLDRKRLPSLETKYKPKDYPAMYDTYKIAIIKEDHYFSWSSSGEESDHDNFYIERLVYGPKHDADLHYDLGRCNVCDEKSLNTENFTMKDAEDYGTNATININNLIFNFRDYDLHVVLKEKSAKVTFDKRAIGGFKHASFPYGAIYEVRHAVPGTLKYKKTTYVNQIDITTESVLEDDIIIKASYKAIDAL